MTRETRIPGPDHPITTEPARARVTVRAHGRVLAETTDALVLREAHYPPVHYLPPGAMDPALLRRTETRTYCPYKGEAGHWAVLTPDGEIADAAWSYDAPCPAVAEIAGRLAFYPSRVEITVEETAAEGAQA
ncbi:DUF427 domain-containing protein [Streptomyces sp. DSM 44917]|uniref:DUF427 domain-containing protein n=1 Tax=Streptomyces boetiae TaxID=3075541 RepID=A0ABU2LF02_9ACTN|nr:DUF427 domain-containing protein [Streptomyces sp. DSM 44917]MDT0310165.1 DUF427 domain-containing protein [Streptomyces sp. DSM 44917]